MFLQVSVCPQGGWVSQDALQAPPPRDGEPPQMENPPWMENPPDGEPPWMENPPRMQNPPWMENPPTRMQNPPGQCAGGTHPTGMHSRFELRCPLR